MDSLMNACANSADGKSIGLGANTTGQSGESSTTDRAIIANNSSVVPMIKRNQPENNVSNKHRSIANEPFIFTMFTSSGKLAKQYNIGDDGSLQKTAMATMYEGKANSINCRPNQFAAVLSKLTNAQAISLCNIKRASPVDIVTEVKESISKGILSRTAKHFPFDTSKDKSMALIVFDFDFAEDNPSITPDEALKKLEIIIPESAHALKLIKYSSSSYIKRAGSDEFINGNKGFHIYMWINDTQIMKSLGDKIMNKAWLNDLGYIRIGADGKMHTRCIVDCAVFSAERLVFEADPVMGKGLVREAPPPQFIDGSILNLKSISKRVAPADKEKIDQIISDYKEMLEPKAKIVTAEYEAKRVTELRNKNKDLSHEDALKTVRARKSGVLQLDDVLFFNTMGDVTVQDILDDPSMFDGKRLADPAEPELGKGLAIFYANISTGVPKIFSHVHGNIHYTFKREDVVAASNCESIEAVEGELMEPFKLPDEDESWFNDTGNVKQVLMDAIGYGELEVDIAVKEIAKVSHFTVTALRKVAKTLEKTVVSTGVDIFPDGRTLKEGTPKQTKPNIKALILDAGIKLRINTMSHEIEAVGIKTRSGNLEEAVISKVEDLAVKEEMPYGRIRNLVTQIAFDDTYHPFDEYLKGLSVWDGKDHIAQLLDSLGYEDTSQDYATKSKMMIIRWLVSVVAAIRRPSGSPSLRIVLVFSGEQHIGKTTWFKLLIPDTSMFKEGGDLNPSCKDSVAQNTKYLITELGEIDSVFDMRSISKLKAFLSKEIDEARLPYDRGTTKNPRKTVFCGTVNDEEYLVDRTGNTRFATIKVMTIDHAKYNAIDKNQLWAQILDMFNNGERWTFNDKEIEIINERNAEHMDVSLIERMVHERFNWSEAKEGWKWKTITEIVDSVGQLDTLARNSKARKEFVGELLKRTKVKKHTTLRTNIYLMPTTIGVSVIKFNDFESLVEKQNESAQQEESE